MQKYVHMRRLAAETEDKQVIASHRGALSAKEKRGWRESGIKEPLS